MVRFRTRGSAAPDCGQFARRSDDALSNRINLTPKKLVSTPRAYDRLTRLQVGRTGVVQADQPMIAFPPAVQVPLRIASRWPRTTPHPSRRTRCNRQVPAAPQAGSGDSRDSISGVSALAGEGNYDNPPEGRSNPVSLRARRIPAIHRADRRDLEDMGHI